MVKTKTNQMLREARVYSHVFTQTVAVGANLGFVTFSTFTGGELHEICEALLGTMDAYAPKVRRIRVTIRALSTETFSLIPMIVQTNGAVAEVANSVERTVDKLVDLLSNDVSGFQLIRDTIVSRLSPAIDSTQFRVLEISFELPSNVIAILNKEVETERLQDLILAYAGSIVTSASIFIDQCIEINYVPVQKKLVIR